jgi:hypothetical protein
MKKHYFTILAYFALTSNINAQIAADYLTETIGVLSGLLLNFLIFQIQQTPLFKVLVVIFPL